MQIGAPGLSKTEFDFTSCRTLCILLDTDQSGTIDLEEFVSGRTGRTTSATAS